MSGEDHSAMILGLRELRDVVLSAMARDKTLAKNMSLYRIKSILKGDCTRADYECFSVRKQYIALIEEINITIATLEYKVEQLQVDTQAELVTTDNSISNLDTTGNFTDVMGDAKVDTDVGTSSYTNQGLRSTSEIGTFLKRPIKLYEVAMALGTPINLNLEVWDDYINTPAVRAKVRNFAYLRGDLHIRISVSGLPFHYGRLLVSPQPLNNGNKNIEYYLLGVAADVNMRPLFLNYLSQAPGSTIINVTENKPVDICMPFISPKHMHRLFNDQSTAIAAATSLTDFEQSGNLHIRSLSNFGSTTGTSTPIYMQVYAWMDNVQIGTNTGTQMAITTESETIILGKKDERKTGPVERASTALHTVSTVLENVPVIGVFAKASSIVLSAISGVASLFGWSKPLAVHPVQQVKNQPFSNGALTIGTDTNKKIAIDPKQELSVDPRVCGTDKDDMIITTIASRVSYLTQFDWLDTSTPLTSPLWACRVHPNLITSYKPSTYRYNQPTAMAFAVQPFAYWRGDIIFRFEVVCSAFHRGKLAVYYEPNISQRSLIDVSIALNKQYVKVIDIQETTTFEFRVNWAAYRAWLLNCTAAEAYKNTDDINGTSGVGYVNGYISVVPFTKLQSPDSSDVKVLVYAYSPNLQVNNYSTANMPNGRRVIAQSETVNLNHTSNCTSSAPVPLLDLNDSTASTNSICEESFGEQVLSFRSCMKRYITNSRGSISVGAMDVMHLVHSLYPVNLVPFTGTGGSFICLYSYLKYAYLGMKGGFRYRVHFAHSNGESLNSHAKFSLGVIESSATATGVTKYSGSMANSDVNGTVTYIPHVMSGYEVEVPLYTNNLFLVAFSDTDTLSIGTDYMSNMWPKTWRLMIDGTGNTVTNYYLIEYAAAEDFSFMRFQGAPMYST